MRFLLIVALYLKTYSTFPMCTNGQTPLMEANDAFTCDRGCPLGFNCEFQDPYKTLSKAICCPNMTALQTLYGDEEHSEPIWDLSEVASLSLGLQAPSELPPTPATIEGANAPSIRPPHKEKEHKIEPEDVEATGQEIATTPTHIATDDAIESSTLATTSASADHTEEVTEDDFTSSTVASDSDEPFESPLQETSFPDESQTTLTAPSETQQLPEITASLETSTTASTSVSGLPTGSAITVEGSGDLTEELGLGNSQKSCDRQRYRVFCRGGKIRTLATLRWAWNEDKGECEFYPWGYCPGDRIIESTTIRTKEECETVCGNKGGAAKFSNGNQPVLARPQLNRRGNTAAKFEPGVRTLAESHSIASFDLHKTVATDTNEDTALVRTTTGNATSPLAEKENSEDNVKITDLVSTPEIEKGNIAPQLEKQDADQQTETTQSTEVASLKFTEADATVEDLVSTPDAEKEDIGSQSGKQENAEQILTDKPAELASEKLPEPETVQLAENHPTAEPFLQKLSELKEIRENAEDNKELASDGNTLVDAEAVPSSLVHERRGENSLTQLQNGNDLSKVDLLGSSQRGGTESSDGIVAIPNETNKGGVLCGATSYRFACQSGMPSQFVYRWEMVDGKCQSFPYGYCYGEFNHGHPRTPEECSLYCSTPGQLFFAI